MSEWYRTLLMDGQPLQKWRKRVGALALGGFGRGSGRTPRDTLLHVLTHYIPYVNETQLTNQQQCTSVCARVPLQQKITSI